jgi:pimeloyl-ACP methyl ester carboxylesterase
LPLVLRLGPEFTTDEQPVLIEPWQWTHVAFVGTGKGVEIYRNGGFLGTLNYGEGGLPTRVHTEGTLQVNGSLNFDVVTDKVNLDQASLRTGVWENDMRFDELIIADEAVRPQISFPAALRTPPAVDKLEKELGELEVDARDEFVIGALIRQARQIDNGADTKSLRAALVQRIGEALKAVRQGKPALHAQRGHMKLSYWSEVDQSEQFYEVYVPNSWKGTSATPLVVALHGGGEDETVLFERYTLEERAEDKGWIIVCPYGRGQGGYQAAGQQDILEVVAQVQHQWSIDSKCIYGVGHSMGAMGTLRLASAKPDFYAAIAPIASPWSPDDLEALRHLPAYWIIGDKDFLFERMKPQFAAIEAFARRTGAPHITQILAGYDHGGFLDFAFPTVVEVSLPPIFDFFAQHHR